MTVWRSLWQVIKMSIFHHVFISFMVFTVSEAKSRPQKVTVWHSLWKVMKNEFRLHVTIFSLFSWFLRFRKLNNDPKKVTVWLSLWDVTKMSIFEHIFYHFHACNVFWGYTCCVVHCKRHPIYFQAKFNWKCLIRLYYNYFFIS